jgi:hypothetical protein
MMMPPDGVCQIWSSPLIHTFQSYQSSFACGNYLLLYICCTLTQAIKKPPDLSRWTTESLLDAFTLVIVATMFLFCEHFLNFKSASTQICSRYKLGLPLSIHFLIHFRYAHVFSLSVNIVLLGSHLFHLDPVSFRICLKLVTFHSKQR